MKFLVTGRGEGKTTRVIEWMRNAPEGETRVLVSHSLRETSRLQQAYPDLASWQLINLEDLRSGYGPIGHRNVVLAIDNLDLVLGTLLKSSWPVELISATGEVLSADKATVTQSGHHA